MRKAKPRKVKIQDLNPGILTAEPMLLTTVSDMIYGKCLAL